MLISLKHRIYVYISIHLYICTYVQEYKGNGICGGSLRLICGHIESRPGVLHHEPAPNLQDPFLLAAEISTVITILVVVGVIAYLSFIAIIVRIRCFDYRSLFSIFTMAMVVVTVINS